MRLLNPFSDVVPHDQLPPASVVAQPFIAPESTRFGYLFPELQVDPNNLLPTSPQTVADLKTLGATMREPGNQPALDSAIPSAYTYFGQFVDHDITLMKMPRVNFGDPNLTPWTPAEIATIKNIRTPTLDLDSVYGEAPLVDDNRMLVGPVTLSGGRPPGKIGDDFDLPRTGRAKGECKEPSHDRAARIGDRRNEETTTIAQLHVAFLRAHNAIVAGGYNYCRARSLLRQYYQMVIAHDFLKRVADPAIVDNMLAKPWPVYDPPENKVFMPLEFSGAVFRFGHSMVRFAYDFNVNFPPPLASLLRLFDVLGRYRTLPERWIIEWEKFVEGGTNKARQIDTQLVGPMFTIPGMPDVPLATRTLLRGYLLRLPTGQAVARALGLAVMTAKEIEAVANPDQSAVLKASGFSSRTPLWFYILAEAAHFQKGQRLGPVGSTMVAGVLIALIRRSKDSFMKVPGWIPTPLGQGPTFSLPDLLQLAGVLRRDFVLKEEALTVAAATGNV